MKVAVVREPGGSFEVAEAQLDDPRDYEVLVDVRASGLCHSDLKVAEQGLVPSPMVLGHEIAGVVSAIGALVTDVAIGDHVAACLVPSCYRCDNCRTGKPFACLRPELIYRRPGDDPRLTVEGEPVDQFWGLSGFAEQVLTHENQLVVIPREIGFDVACLLGCGVVTGAGAVVNTAGVRFGDTVAVFGAGGVGLNVVQAAALSGAKRVVVVDLQPGKLELAKRFGATDLVNPADGDSVEQIRAVTGGLGVDHAFEVIGLKPTAMQALASTKKGGQAYLIGLQRPGTSQAVDFDLDLMAPQAGLRGVHMGSVNAKHDIPLYADLYLQGRFDLDDLVSRRIGLDEIDEGYELLKKGEVARSVIVFE